MILQFFFLKQIWCQLLKLEDVLQEPNSSSVSDNESVSSSSLSSDFNFNFLLIFMRRFWRVL